MATTSGQEVRADDYFLGLDLGTTNIKSVAVDPHGKVIAVGSSPVARHHVECGGVEQNIAEIWNAVRTAVRAASKQCDSSKIRAIGVSSQGGALQILDAEDAPLGPVISWLDPRGNTFDTAFTAEMGADYFARRIGHGASAVAIGQLLRLKNVAPKLLESPNRIAFVGDAIVGKLCGCRAHDPTSLSIAMLYNPWLERSDPEILDKIGIDDAQLPCLMPATAMAGTLQKDIAEDLGLPADIPVSPAVHDQYAASLGAASVSEGDVNFGAGTAWVLLANSAKLATPVTPDAFVCRHPVDGLFGQMLSMLNGGSAIHWAMNLTGSRENDVQSVEDILENTTPGADGLRCWPFLAGAPRGKDGLAMKGRLSGISLAHDRSHLLRAVVEGLACELRRHIEQLAEGGISLRRLVMCGSAASGRHTPRIIAEVTGLPVSCVETPDISALGAAMLARSLVNRNIALADIARAWEPPKRTVQSSENAAIYRDLYSEYLSVVEANKNS